ncbi:MAG: hypothetical protein A3H96_11490 [Acidobacteria bacterium RIFCSPLOWO2_02_FULL_67_36]|nr:MAG: hypothetical protein A3H96_11490 [Acidobacteria bacterium RIFCSPLOWO2_02_FULL_67_36]OGA76284.1 MAG: hypothetical protein A3G27_05725 [Betaproteobacteria bacterium RIFCSPLOWO2_12_FULL_66_14]
MKCLSARQRRAERRRDGDRGFGGVQTAPCPMCRSFHTRAFLKDGVVLSRGCLTCGHEWDQAGQAGAEVPHV